MDAKQFLAEFGHIVNAPGGVQRVKDNITLCCEWQFRNQLSY